MNATMKLGAALLALALLVMPALAASQYQPEASREIAATSQQTPIPSHGGIGTVLLLWVSALGILGTTITYLFPVASTTTAPTAIESSRVPTVVAQVVFVDADTTAALTHNFGIATAAGFAGLQPNIAQGFPQVILDWIATSTVVATIGYTNTSGNVVTLTKASLLGTAGTMFVTISKPHTLCL